MTDREMEEIKGKMASLASFVVPGKNRDEARAEEYYRLQKLFSDENSRRLEAFIRESEIRSVTEKSRVNGFGEATSREIASQSYRNSQKRLSRQIMGLIS